MVLLLLLILITLLLQHYTLTFAGNAGETQTFSVTPTADTKLEADETLAVSMNNLAGTSLAVDITDGAAVTIENDDAANAVLSVTINGDETGPVNIIYTLTLSNTNNTGSTITFNLDDLQTGTATSGNDYTTVPADAQINVLNGEISGNYEISVINDTEVESLETVIVEISNSSNSAVLISTNSAIAEITDNDNHAVYTVEPARNVDSYENSDVLATVSDADGNVVSAVVTSGNLPAGTAINAATGEITVNNESLLVDGTYSFEVTTTDAEGGITTQTVTITFGSDTEAVYTVEPARNVDSYENSDVLATVSDADGNVVSAVVTSGNLPAGTAINAATGEITVNNESALVDGTYSFEVTTTDAEGGITTQTVTITFGADTEAVYTVEPARNVDSYENNDVLATVSDADGNVVSAVVTSGNLPAGTAINAATGEITVNNESLLVDGTYSFEVTTTDAEGGITTQTVTITFGGDTESVYTVEPARKCGKQLRKQRCCGNVSDAVMWIMRGILGNLPLAAIMLHGEITVIRSLLVAELTASK